MLTVIILPCLSLVSIIFIILFSFLFQCDGGVQSSDISVKRVGSQKLDFEWLITNDGKRLR